MCLIYMCILCHLVGWVLIRIPFYSHMQSEVRKVYKLLMEARDTEGEEFSGFDFGPG